MPIASHLAMPSSVRWPSSSISSADSHSHFPHHTAQTTSWLLSRLYLSVLYDSPEPQLGSYPSGRYARFVVASFDSTPTSPAQRSLCQCISVCLQFVHLAIGEDAFLES